MAAPMRSFLRLHQLSVRNALSRALFSSHCHLCSVASPAPATERWQLMTAVCLERVPIISSQKGAMEEKYQASLDKQELEGSLLSDHELRHAKDLVVAARRKREDYEETEADITRVTALDLEDLWEAEHKLFMSRYSDTGNTPNTDLKSTDRDLDEKLTLIVRQKLGNSEHWVLPQNVRQDGLSMRESAESALQSLCGEEINAKFLGNAPCGFMKYKYPPSSEYTGAKVFFFKALFNGGNVTLKSSDVTDYLWVKKDDLHKYVPERYLEVLDDFVLNV